MVLFPINCFYIHIKIYNKNLIWYMYYVFVPTYIFTTCSVFIMLLSCACTGLISKLIAEFMCLSLGKANSPALRICNSLFFLLQPRHPDAPLSILACYLLLSLLNPCLESNDGEILWIRVLTFLGAINA